MDLTMEDDVLRQKEVVSVTFDTTSFLCTICSQILVTILQTIENNLDFPEITHDFTKITHGITKITHDVIPKFSRKFSCDAVK